MIQKQERILYARVFSKVLEGEKDQLKLMSLLGNRLMRRGVSIKDILDLHLESFTDCFPARNAENRYASEITGLSTLLLRTILISYTEAYDDLISALREKSIELEMRATSLEEEVGARTLELENSREELVQRLDDITKDQTTMLSMIEDLNRINRELNSTREKLKNSEKLAILGKLALGLSHELRNPLGVIGNCAEILETQMGAEKSGSEKWTSRIKEQVKRCNRVIESLLGFGMHEFKSDHYFSVTEAITDAVKRCPGGEKVNTHSLMNTSVWMKGDQEQLTQAVYNLIINGLESIEENGEENEKVTVSLKPMVAGNGGKQAGVEITVVDTGAGVTEEQIPLLFEPFYSTKAGNVGLGLSLSRAIVQKHGGTVSFMRCSAGETCFSIRLPIEEGLSSDR